MSGRLVDCPACEGIGEDADGEECQACKGKGQITASARLSYHRAEMAERYGERDDD